jgi:ethanolamine ammonia-lyase small subunit
MAGRTGGGVAYRTSTALELRRDHAAAVDAVWDEVSFPADLGAENAERFGLFEVRTRCRDKREYLLRPDLGRSLSDEARAALGRLCPREADVQIVVGDGLSAAAVRAQVPGLLPRLMAELSAAGLSAGRPFFVRYCRVGVLNDVGEALSPAVAVLLVGERPGLATAESLSAYLAYRPRAGHTDADRNLISNIHARGVSHDAAAVRIAALVRQMLARRLSGVSVKEELAGLPSAERPKEVGP